MGGIVENLEQVKQRIKRAALKVGRQPSEVRLVAVTKNVPVALVEQAIKAGVADIGENRAKEVLEKHSLIGDKVNWHFVGHLQRNKVKSIIGFVDLIQSVDSLRLAGEIDRQAARAGKIQDVLVEVSISGEAGKYGLSPSEVEKLLTDISRQFRHMKVRGLMAMAPLEKDPEEVRPFFSQMKTLFEESRALNLTGVEMEMLSMGMSNDFETAIEEGSTMVRIGTAIFQQIADSL